MSDWEPTWLDRQGYGLHVPLPLMVEHVADHPAGGLEWRHIGFTATMVAESDLFEWSRPMVWAPDKVHHLSVDRGVCALNSYWWSRVADVIAYDWRDAVDYVLDWIFYEADFGTKDAKPWDWRPLLDWQWNAYGTDRYLDAVPSVRVAVNEERATRGMREI